MKKQLLSLFFLCSATGVFAQDGATPSFMADPLNHPLTPFYALVALVVVVLLLVMAAAVTMIRVLNTLTERAAQEHAERLGIVYKRTPSLFNRLLAKMNASVPVEEEKTIELDHNYDGIKELDNHLPPWWKWLFYGTIAWSVIYIVAYHLTDSMPLMEQEYKNEIAVAEETRQKLQANQPKVEIDESTLTYTPDAEIVAKGKEMYSINCAPCHKADGGGGIGPNLTDEYWLHGGDVQDVYATIKNGVPEKGMVAWAAVLSPQQLRDVSFFVMSLQGTNPPGAKGAQGELHSVPATQLKTDTLKAQAKL